MNNEKSARGWAQFVDPTGLEEFFAEENAPKRHVTGRLPPAGVDNMNFKTVDTFSIPGKGKEEYKVDFKGYFQVTRGNPSSDNWNDHRMIFNYTAFKLFGSDSQLGSITVDLNPDFISGGETFNDIKGVAKCRAATSVRFHVHDWKMTVFNKEPILIRNADMKGIPTIGEGAIIDTYHLPLYSVDDPEGDPKVYLETLQYTVLNYMTREETMAYRAADSEASFNKLISSS